jgi:rubrerythrin
MGKVTIEQAIRNAVEAERAAARFYSLLGDSTEDPEAKLFLQQMHEDELKHAAAIEHLAQGVTSRDLPARAEDGYAAVETAPAWKYVDGIDYLSALRVALEAEHSAALYYGAVAEAFTGEQKQFFEDLSSTEEMHADRVEQMIEKVVI